MAESSEGDPRVHNLTPQDVARGMEEGRMLLVDVREPNEIEVEAYPVDWRVGGQDDLMRFTNLMVEGFGRTDTAMREWVGLVMYRIAGRTATLFPGPAGRRSGIPGHYRSHSARHWARLPLRIRRSLQLEHRGTRT